jgi:phage I-like protein
MSGRLFTSAQRRTARHAGTARGAHRRLSVLVPDGDPPREILLFRSGKNSTTKGVFVFDAAAAKSVMRSHQQHGARVMLDLEHLSLDQDHPNYDPDSRGWGTLTVRDGALWLTGIQWTDDGAARLRERRQIYVSPAFDVDDANRVTRIFNVAITALPATDDPMPLVAAHRAAARRRSNAMPPEKDDEKEMLGRALKRARLRKLLGLEEDATDEQVAEAVADMDPAGVIEILEAATEALEPVAEAMPPADDEMLMEDEDKAIAASARKLTGKRTRAEVLAALTGLAASRSTVDTQTARLRDLEATVLRGELRELVRANPRKIASPKLEAHVMASESVTAAKALIDVLPEVVASAVQQPEHDHEKAVRLTDEERHVAKLTGQDPADLLAYKEKKAKQQRA